ncbi:MAG: UDP-N-acetylmuramoyl-L-alanine--D-glutamate ligase, partial [Pseudomonadota bacterium]
VATVSGVRFVNDSKATNPDAAARALASYDNVYWIAGGQAKGDDFSALDQALSGVKRAFLIGQSAEVMASALAGKVATTITGTLDQAIQKAFAAARSDDDPDPVVLLSPACASFDQFENFEKRGDRFCELAMTLADAQGDRLAAGGSR